MSAIASKEQRRLTTIMFSDMVGYSALSQRNEELALQLLNEHREILRRAFARHEGREIETVGDGFFVEFPSALASARCAADIQQSLHERNATVPSDRSILVRIGLHIGDVVVQGNHVHGDGVNIAARIEPLAEPGGVCLSEDVARQIQNKIEWPLRKLGRADLKNIELPVQIFRLVLPWQGRHMAASERLAFSLRRRQTRYALIAGVVLLVAAAVVGEYAWQRRATPGVVNHRLAVLPFVSLSPDRADEYFADGITEELIARLSQVSGLEVIARTSVMSYKSTPKKIAEIGRELNVGTVLEGSVRKDGNKLRITAQLIRADNDAHLWAEGYDQDMKDALAIQKSIADRVAVAMATTLGTGKPALREVRGTQNGEAYNAYLKGRFHLNKSTPEGVKQAIVHFEDAIRLDPSFALAYVGLAGAYEQLPLSDDTFSNVAYPKARLAAVKAIELDPSLAEAHSALAVVKTFHDYDWEGADADFRRALALNPNSSATHWWYAWHLMFLRRFDEGIAEMQRAVELDPVSVATNTDLGWVLQFRGRWDESLGQLKKTLELDRSNPNILGAFGWAYLGKKMYKEAEETFLREVQAFPGREPWVLIDPLSVYALRGDTSRALDFLNEIKRASKVKPVSGWTWTIAYLSLASQDRRYRTDMYRGLNQAADEHSFWLVHTSNPWWTAFHSDPQWIAFRARLRLPP
jgi:TolB-like protein/class 3 adenylate cyclase/Tfp pilus assembly protein PilF